MHASLDHKTHDQISLIRVNSEKELRRYNVDDLAKNIHGSSAPRTFPLFLIYYRGAFRGYLQMIEQMVIYPALHPDLMEPRDFIAIASDLATQCKRAYGNPLFLLCPKAEQLGEKHMASIRIKKAPETAYVYSNPEEEGN